MVVTEFADCDHCFSIILGLAGSLLLHISKWIGQGLFITFCLCAYRFLYLAWFITGCRNPIIVIRCSSLDQWICMLGLTYTATFSLNDYEGFCKSMTPNCIVMLILLLIAQSLLTTIYVINFHKRIMIKL